MLRPLLAGLALAAACVMLAWADEPTKAVPLPGVDWHARAEKWFKASDEDSRKAQMKEASRALKRPCKYCHTEDFSGYTENKELAQQMMALSAENDVTCQDCHDGRDKFTKMGEDAKHMWALSVDKKMFCDDCHQPQTKFEKLTEKGKKFHDEWEAMQKAKKAAVGAAAAPTSAPPAPSPSTQP
jgi:RNase P subunit RPR2